MTEERLAVLVLGISVLALLAAGYLLHRRVVLLSERVCSLEFRLSSPKLRRSLGEDS